MIRLSKVTRNYGVHEVLKGVDWAIPPRARVGLVGPNGAGKTTLLRYLPQEGARLAEGTVLEALLAPFSEILAMEKDLERLHHEMATATGERLESLTRRSAAPLRSGGRVRSGGAGQGDPRRTRIRSRRSRPSVARVLRRLPDAGRP